MERPKSVTTAVRLLWVSLVISIVGLGYICSDKEVRDVIAFGGSQEAVNMVYLVFGFSFLTVVTSAFFIYKISKGRNWARLIFSGLVLAGTPTTVMGLFDTTEAAVIRVIMGLQLVVQVAAVVFLMQKESVAWFKPPKDKKVG